MQHVKYLKLQAIVSIRVRIISMANHSEMIVTPADVATVPLSVPERLVYQRESLEPVHEPAPGSVLNCAAPTRIVHRAKNVAAMDVDISV